MSKLAKTLITLNILVVFALGVLTLINYYNNNIKKNYFSVN
jgi:hypothetical protein